MSSEKYEPLALLGLTHVLNVGLDVKNGPRHSDEYIIATLRRWGFEVVRFAQSNTERTAVAVGKGTSPAVYARIAEELQQEAVAVFDPETNLGELYGPGAEAWRPFNPAYFLPALDPACR